MQLTTGLYPFTDNGKHEPALAIRVARPSFHIILGRRTAPFVSPLKGLCDILDTPSAEGSSTVPDVSNFPLRSGGHGSAAASLEIRTTVCISRGQLQRSESYPFLAMPSDQLPESVGRRRPGLRTPRDEVRRMDKPSTTGSEHGNCRCTAGRDGVRVRP